MQKFYWPSSYQSSHKGDTVCRNVDGRHTDKAGNTSQLSSLSTPQYSPNYAPTLSSLYSTLTIPVNTSHCGVQVKIVHTHSDNTYHGQTTHCTVTSSDRERRQVTGEEIYSSPSIPPVRLRQAGKVTGQRWSKKNKTWNQNTLAQAEYEHGIQQERRKGKRQSVQNIDFLKHNYENVYDNTNNVAALSEDLHSLNLTPNRKLNESDVKPQASNRQTPRSRKKGKPQKLVYRSKSCDREGVGASVLDSLWRLTDRLTNSPDCSMSSHSSDQHPPPPPVTPTPSIFQSVAARAIPCVDIKVTRKVQS